MVSLCMDWFLSSDDEMVYRFLGRRAQGFFLYVFLPGPFPWVFCNQAAAPKQVAVECQVPMMRPKEP
jgi:hypothetical protein